ncbi:unnamed protein product [Closterium sp. NIES-54]
MEGLLASEWPEATSFPQPFVTGDPVHTGDMDDIIGNPDAVLERISARAFTADLPHDLGMYQKESRGKFILLVTYIDDLLYIGDDTELLDQFEEEIKEKLEVTINQNIGIVVILVIEALAPPCCAAPPAAEPRPPAEPRFSLSRAALPSRTALHCPTASAATAATTAIAATAATTATAPTAAMARPTVLTFDAEGRAVDFDVWVDDLQLFLQCDSRDGVSLFDHTSGVSTAPAATADSTVRSQWTTRDAVARLAVRSHLPPAERAHFGQYKTAQSLYDAVVARYSSPDTAALSRLMLPYLFPDLAAFATVADLVAHLRTSDARYRAALPPEDHFLSLCPTELTVDLLEERLAAAEKSIVAVGASRSDRRTPFIEGCSLVPLLPSVASAAVVDLVGTKKVGAASAPSGRRRNSKGKGSKGGGGGGGGGGGCWCNPTVCIRLVVRVRACVCAWNGMRA